MPGDTHPDLDWPEIKLAWNARAAVPGGINTIEEFAAEFGTTLRTVQQHRKADATDRNAKDGSIIKADPWRFPQKPEKTNRKPSVTARAETKRPPISYDPEDDVPVPVESVDGEDPNGVRGLLALNAQVVRRTLRRLVRGKIVPTGGQSEIGLVSQLTGMVKDLADMARRADAEAAGRQPPPDVPVAPPPPERPSFVVEHRLLDPVKVAVDGEGRMTQASAQPQALRSA